MHKHIKTKGLLLHKTWLANDDAILDFFTMDMGKISVFARKLGRSKKRLAELDFFRFLELELFHGRNTYSLQSVNTQALFSGFTRNYSALEIGMDWCDKIRKIVPEEKPSSLFFTKMIKIFGHYKGEANDYFDSFFRIKLLDFNGVFPRFDQIRSDIYFCPASLHISLNYLPEAIKIENTSRQVLEFFRRSTTEIFMEKMSRLPARNVSEAATIIDKVENFYY